MFNFDRNKRGSLVHTQSYGQKSLGRTSNRTSGFDTHVEIDKLVSNQDAELTYNRNVKHDEARAHELQINVTIDKRRNSRDSVSVLTRRNVQIRKLSAYASRRRPRLIDSAQPSKQSKQSKHSRQSMKNELDLIDVEY